MRLRENSSSASEAAALLPRIRPATRLSFCGLIRSVRATAWASLSASLRSCAFLLIDKSSACGRRAGRALCLAVGRVAVQRPRRSELAELVTDHFLGDVHRDVLVAVVDAERQPDELRQDGGATAPDLDHLVAGRTACGLCLLQQIAIDERTLPDGTRHDASPYLFFRAWRLATMNFCVCLLVRVFLPFVGLPHGGTGWRPPEVRPSPPPCG